MEIKITKSDRKYISRLIYEDMAELKFDLDINLARLEKNSEDEISYKAVKQIEKAYHEADETLKRLARL